MAEYIAAFDQAEMLHATNLVNGLVQTLQGRKLEEGDWTSLYCAVKNAPEPGWSNLPFRDYVHDGVGVEFKLLSRPSPSGSMGSSIMHPAATRQIDFDPNGTAEEAMIAIFGQWSASIQSFEQRVRKSSSRNTADLRWGVLLWAPDHSEFLYFEERLAPPEITNFTAKWHDGNHRGNPTRNLHILDRATGSKQFSCTLPRNGAKLQPYFKVPTIEQGANLFRPEPNDTVPIYIKKADADSLLKLFPDLLPHEAVNRLIQESQ